MALSSIIARNTRAAPRLAMYSTVVLLLCVLPPSIRKGCSPQPHFHIAYPRTCQACRTIESLEAALEQKRGETIISVQLWAFVEEQRQVHKGKLMHKAFGLSKRSMRSVRSRRRLWAELNT